MNKILETRPPEIIAVGSRSFSQDGVVQAIKFSQGLIILTSPFPKVRLANDSRWPSHEPIRKSIYSLFSGCKKVPSSDTDTVRHDIISISFCPGIGTASWTS